VRATEKLNLPNFIYYTLGAALLLSTAVPQQGTIKRLPKARKISHRDD
jgi:hypothetical protein